MGVCIEYWHESGWVDCNGCSHLLMIDLPRPSSFLVFPWCAFLLLHLPHFLYLIFA